MISSNLYNRILYLQTVLVLKLEMNVDVFSVIVSYLDIVQDYDAIEAVLDSYTDKEYDIIMKFWKKHSCFETIEENNKIKYYINGVLHRDDGPAMESKKRIEWWRYGLLHRDDGPAVVGSSLEWFRHGLKHRDDGPAFVQGKNTEWWLNGKRHREDGPAIEYENGTTAWFFDGKLHCDDGPAIIHPNGYMIWYKNGKRIKDST